MAAARLEEPGVADEVAAVPGDREHHIEQAVGDDLPDSAAADHIGGQQRDHLFFLTRRLKREFRRGKGDPDDG